MIFLGLVPPELNGKEVTPEMRAKYQKAKKRWRYSLAFAHYTELIAGGLFALWAVGSLAGWFGMGRGFALAEDMDRKGEELTKQIEEVSKQVQQTNTTLMALVLGQMRTNMRELRRLQCKAREEQNLDLVRKYGDELEARMTEYYDIVKREWIIPACGDV
jgi:hypothetical protein